MSIVNDISRLGTSFRRITLGHLAASAKLWDCIFLSVLVQLSFVFYVGQLGFYSDDWSLLGWLATSKDQSLPGFFTAIFPPEDWMRPAQIAYYAITYWLFGANPLGYQLLNALVLNLAILFFYMALRELGMPHVLSVAVPAVYALLPHYATDRFWMAAFGYTLMMALYFASLYTALRSVRSDESHFAWWMAASVICLILSGLTLEVALPLFLLNLGLIWFRAHKLGLSKSPDSGFSLRWLRISVPTLGALLLVGVFKYVTTTRLASDVSIFEQMYWIVRDMFALDWHSTQYGLNLYGALSVNLGTYGLGLPRLVILLVQEQSNPMLNALAFGIGCFVFFGFLLLLRNSGTGVFTRLRAARLILVGGIAFGLGYAIFLTNYLVQFTPTGIGNRTAIAAATGVAFVAVGLLVCLASLLPERLRSHVFALSIAFLCAGGFLINNVLAGYWITAYRSETAILSAIQRNFPTLPAGSTIILDDFCPYEGPAVVFESNWDLRGALMLLYHDSSLRADVVTRTLTVDDSGLTTKIYDVNEMKYPFGDNMWVFRYRSNMVIPLRAAQVARHYFATFNPQLGNDCPEGHAGLGVAIY